MSRLKALARESLLYGLSSMLSRFLNFLLVPFYTHVLGPSDFGVSNIVFACIAFFSILWQAGFDTAYLRQRHDLDDLEGKRLFATAFRAQAGSATLLSTLLWFAAPLLSHWLVIPVAHQGLMRWAAVILWLDTLAVVPMAHLRYQHAAFRFSMLRLLNVVVNISGNLWFVLHLRRGLEGVFWANVCASAIGVLPLLPLLLKQLRGAGSFARDALKQLLALGLPLVPAGLYGIVNDIAGRLFLGWMLTDADVERLHPGRGWTVLSLTGIFSAAWKLGIFGLLLTQMYRLAWQPFFMQHGKDADARQLFGKVLRILLLLIGATTGGLMLSLDYLVAIPVLGHPIIAPEYWSGLGLVPIVLLAYAFQAVFIHFTLGLYLAKQTRYLIWSNGVGAAVTVIGNLLLIPRIGIWGAAWSAAACYAVIAVMVMRKSQQLFPIELQLRRLLPLGIWLLVVHLVGLWVQIHPTDFTWTLRLALYAALLIAPLLLGIVSLKDLKALRT